MKYYILYTSKAYRCPDFHGCPISSMALTKALLAPHIPHNVACMHAGTGASVHPLHASTFHPRLTVKRVASADHTGTVCEDTNPPQNCEQSRRGADAGDDGNERADVCADPRGPAAAVRAAQQRLLLHVCQASAPVLMAAETEKRSWRQ